jgi:hypothetical protein
MTTAGHTEYLHMCEDVGFAGTHIELHIDSAPPLAARIETMLNMSPNPIWPTASEQMEKLFTAEEREQFIDHMRPLVESGKGIARFSNVFIWAFKARSLRNPGSGPDGPRFPHWSSTVDRAAEKTSGESRSKMPKTMRGEHRLAELMRRDLHGLELVALMIGGAG